MNHPFFHQAAIQKRVYQTCALEINVYLSIYFDILNYRNFPVNYKSWGLHCQIDSLVVCIYVKIGTDDRIQKLIYFWINTFLSFQEENGMWNNVLISIKFLS